MTARSSPTTVLFDMNESLIKSLVWLTAVLAARCSAAPVPNVVDLSRVNGKIQDWIDKDYYHGAGLLITRHGQVICEKYFGANKPETVAFIASSGKWLAAATIAAVVDVGKLQWDDPASKWISELANDPKGQATLRQLLSHTAGYEPYQPKDKPRDDYQTLTESVVHIVPLSPKYPPGEQFEYGGLAMQVAGRMAELAAGKEWEQLFQEMIAQPLRMTSTHFTPVDNGGGHSPMLGGGARSTLRDYANFLLMISDDGMFEGKRIVSEASIHEMQADQVRYKVNAGEEFVERARGLKHSGIYGLGEGAKYWMTKAKLSNSAAPVGRALIPGSTSSGASVGSFSVTWMSMRPLSLAITSTRFMQAPNSPLRLARR